MYGGHAPGGDLREQRVAADGERFDVRHQSQKRPILEPATIVLSALKPADDGDGLVVRVLNPNDTPTATTIRFGFPVAAARAVRLDETGTDDVAVEGGEIRTTVPARALRSFRVIPVSK